MKRRSFIGRLLALLAAPFVIPACKFGDDDEDEIPGIPGWPNRWFLSPNGVKYGFLGPWPNHTPDYYPSNDGVDEEYLTIAEVGIKLDQAIDAGAAAHGVGPAYARTLAYIIVDDFGFSTSYSPTNFAAGMTDAKTYMFIGLWTRYQGTADKASIPAGSPTWTHRPPGLNGYSVWRYGFGPYFQAMTHELCHVYFPTQPCGHKNGVSDNIN